MRKLSSILEEVNHKNEIKSISCENSLSKYFKENLNNNNLRLKSVLENSPGEENLNKIKIALQNRDESKILNDAELSQQHSISLDQDPQLKDFIFALDCISAFKVISDMFDENKKAEERNISWFDCQVKIAIDETMDFVEQLAALISFVHDDVKIQVDYDIANFENSKQLASLIKAEPEYKIFRRIVRRKHDFSNQKIDVRSLCLIILEKAKKLISII